MAKDHAYRFWGRVKLSDLPLKLQARVTVALAELEALDALGAMEFVVRQGYDKPIKTKLQKVKLSAQADKVLMVMRADGNRWNYVEQIAVAVGIPRRSAQHQLNTLETLGLVKRRKDKHAFAYIPSEMEAANG